ncbi:MAG: trigger factor [Planctomycetes bacterium]|nr:trigger factor [Planctomycetota bacterium]
MAEKQAGTDEKKVEGQEAKTAANKVTVKDVGPCKKKVTIAIPEETIRESADEQYETLRKDIVVPGFRRGRAPRRLLEKRYGKETSDQIKLKLVAEASESALKDKKIDVLREPDIDYKDLELPESGDMTFDFEVEVRPDFELPELKGIAIKKTIPEIGEKEIDAELEQLKTWSGSWSPREAGAAIEANDQIIANALLKIEGVEEEENLDNINIFARANSSVGPVPVENLEEVLVGAKVGDSRETNVEVPKTYFKEEYRGKKVEVKIEVKDIKWLKPAELNKALFDKFGVEDEKELREKIADSLETRSEQQSQTDMSEQIYKYMLDNTKFDLPTDVVAEQAMNLLQRQYTNLLRQGLQPEQLSAQVEQLRAASDEQAEQQLKVYFIMDKVADKLKVEVSEEEINGRIAQLAIGQGQRPEKMREAMSRDGSLSQFSLQVREEKCISKILESAKISEVKASKKPVKSEKKAVKTKETKKAVKKTAKKTVKKAEPKEKKTVKKAKKTAKKKTEK